MLLVMLVAKNKYGHNIIFIDNNVVRLTIKTARSTVKIFLFYRLHEILKQKMYSVFVYFIEYEDNRCVFNTFVK